MKKILVTFLLISFAFICSAYRKPEQYVIDPVHNAYVHNNMGLNALEEHNYILAISEFCLAIQLNPNSQATSVYYKNLGNAYTKIGYYQNAQTSYERSRTIYNLDFDTYVALAQTYRRRNLLKYKISAFKKSKNPVDMVMLGLLYIESGNKARGITKLDEFCARQPDMFITPQVRAYIPKVLYSKHKKR